MVDSTLPIFAKPVNQTAECGMEMTNSRDITPTSIGLRSYDTAIGFRNLDIRSAALTDFDPTHTIGMAAILAGAIKGKDVIRNAKSLKKIDADVLKINPP
jgi:hypothetical protein